MFEGQSSALGRELGRHDGRILAGGWLYYIGALLAAASVTWILATPWLGAVATAILVVAALLAGWRQRDQSVTVYERGVVWRRGRDTKVVRWDEVTHVMAQTVDEQYILTITTRDGREVVFDDSLADVHGLHVHIVNATRDRDR
jgi:hypothetical protein